MRDNPFVTSGYAGPAYFCDRIDETEMLTHLQPNGNDIALMSSRRMGKNDLVKHCFFREEIKSHFYTFVIDIYATDSFRDFVNVFSKSILEDMTTSSNYGWKRNE